MHVRLDSNTSIVDVVPYCVHMSNSQEYAYVVQLIQSSLILKHMSPLVEITEKESRRRVIK